MSIKGRGLVLARVFGMRSCYASDRLVSVVQKFKNSHTPLIAYRDDGIFEGILTVDAALFAHKHNPSTLVRPLLSIPPTISNDTPPVEVLRLMKDSRLYTLPIVDTKKNVIGLVSAKKILKKLIQNPHLATRLVESMPIRKVITIPESESIGYAFQMFAKHNISRLICVDKRNKIRGIVTKRDILLPFFSPSSRQRFSTRSSATNYSFDIEQIKRNKDGLASYVSPISKTIHEGVDGLSIIQTILNHKYNSIVTVDNLHRPQTIYSMRYILDTVVRLISQAPYLLTIISKLPKEISAVEKDIVFRNILRVASWINKQQPIKLVHMSNNVVRSKEGKVTLFEVRITIKTGSTYYAKHKNRDFVQATKVALREIKKQVSKSRQLKKHL